MSYDEREIRVRKNYLEEQNPAICCVCFHSGEELLRELRQQRSVDIVVLSSQLEDMDGYEFLKRLNSLHNRPLLLLQGDDWYSDATASFLRPDGRQYLPERSSLLDLLLDLRSSTDIGIFWVLLDFGTTLAGALSGALINDVVPAELLGRFFALFRAVSLVAGMLFNAFLLGLVESYSLYIFVGVGIFYGIGLLSLCTKVKEGTYPPVEDAVAPVGVRHTVFQPVATYFRQSFSIPYYRWVIVGLVFSYLAAAPFNIFSIFYAKSLNMDMREYGLLLTLTYAVSLVMSYFLGMLADRFHPLRTSLVAQILYLVTMLAGWFVVTGNGSFGVLLVIHGIISGCFFTLSASLGQKLFPRELFAQFNSAFSMLLAIGNVILGPLFGWMLDQLARDYRYTFLFGAVLTALSVISLWKVFRGYLAYGGDAAYTPPDPGE